MNRSSLQHGAGFTLVEMLIAVAVIGILATIGYSSVLRLNAKYRLSDAQQTMTQAFNSARSETRRLSLNRQVSWDSGSGNTKLVIRDETGAELKTANLQYGVTFGTGGATTRVIYYAPYSRATAEGAAGTDFDLTLTEPKYGFTAIVRVVGVTGKVIRVVK